jgi:sugar phosphate isomerase/epimerase
MRPGYMTSVCPDQTLPQLIDTARRHGYEGIEFRVEWGHKHGIELGSQDGPTLGTKLALARRMLAEHGIAASCIATSCRFNSPEAADHLPQRESLRRYIALARELDAPYIRTFSDSLPEGEAAEREKVLSLAAESYAAVDAWAGEHGVIVLVETHTNMRGEWARRILDQAGARNLKVLWHIGHHLSRGQSVDEAYAHIGGQVAHVHFSAPDDDDIVTDADNLRSFELLSEAGFDGFFSVEIINPPDPEAVLALHIRKFRAFVAAVEDDRRA